MDDESDVGRQTQESCAPVDGLPDELLLAVFALLPAADLAAGVGGSCKRWRALSRTPSLWRRADAIYELQTSARSEFCRILKVAPVLRSVTLKNSILPLDVIGEMLEGCATVRELRVAVPLRIHTSSMASLLRHYALHLQELSLHLTTGAQEVWGVVASMECLRVLRLSACQPLHSDEPGPSSLLLGYRSLRVLDLEGLSGADRIPSYVLELLRSRGDQLLDLTLPKRSPLLSDALLEELLSSWCTRLESLGAGYECVPFLNGLERLTRLRLWYEYCDQDESRFAALRTSTAWVRVRQLALEPDSRLQFGAAVLRACTGLTALRLSGDTERLHHLLGHAPPTLSSLTLRCPLLQARDVRSVAGLLPRLSLLDLRGCPGIAKQRQQIVRDLSASVTVITDRRTGWDGTSRRKLEVDQTSGC